MTEAIVDPLKRVKFDENAKRLSVSDIAETVEDPFCDEKNPRVISFQDVCQAVIFFDKNILEGVSKI